jgi:hypothetical protein
MIQAYYYATQGLAWAKQHLAFEPTGLRLRTQVGAPERSNVAFYYGKEIRIGSGDDVAFSRMALDPTIVTHETMHGVIEPLTYLPFTGEGGSLQEGLADTLTAIQLDDPNMGDASYKSAPYQRTLNNNMVFTERTGALYHDSLIFSGLLWDIHEHVDAATAEDLIKYFLAHFTPASNFTTARAELAAWMAQAPDQDKAKLVQAIAARRGWQ